jgi:hypothetical protein
MNTVIRHLRRTVLLQDGAGRTDGELLESFINQKDEAAFEARDCPPRRTPPGHRQITGIC